MGIPPSKNLLGFALGDLLTGCGVCVLDDDVGADVCRERLEAAVIPDGAIFVTFVSVREELPHCDDTWRAEILFSESEVLSLIMVVSDVTSSTHRLIPSFLAWVSFAALALVAQAAGLA